MATTNITTEFATIGADKVVSAMAATDAALVKATESARRQTDVQQKQAEGLRKLRDAEREEQQQQKQAAGIIAGTITAEERYQKEIAERQLLLKKGLLTQGQYNRAVGESRARLDAATGSNKSMIGSIAQTAGAVAGVTGAVGVLMLAARALRAEWQNLVDRQKNAKDRAIGFENALTETRFNVGKFMSAEEQRATALELSTKYGIAPERAAMLLGKTATSTGIQNKDDLQTALNAAAGAAAIRPDLADEELAALGAAAGSLGKTFNITPQQAIGFINQVGQQSNIGELSKQVDNITPAVAGLMANGFTEGEAGALLATITQKGFDTEGAKSFTGTVAVADSLRQAFGDREEFQREDGSFNAIAAIEYLQNNQADANTFIRGGKLESGKKIKAAKLGKGQLRPFFEQLFGLLEGDTDDRFAASVDVIGSFEDAGLNYDQLLADNKANNRLSNLDRGFDAAIQSIQATESTAISGILRERLPELEQSLGGTSIGQKISQISREFSSNAGTDSAAATQAAFEQLLATMTQLESAGGDRNNQLAGFLRPVIQQLQDAVPALRTQQISEGLSSATGSQHNKDAQAIAQAGFDEFLQGVVDPEYRDYLRERVDLNATGPVDPREAAQKAIENFDLAGSGRFAIKDPESFAQKQLAAASAGLSAEQQQDLQDRLSEGNNPASRGTGRLRPLHDARDIIDNFDLEKTPQGASVLAVLEKILQVNEKQIAPDNQRPFIPEPSRIPPDTVLLSRGAN
jgi:hypothetical protein